MDKEWNEKKVSLGGAIVIGAVLAVLGGVIGANYRSWFSGFAPYLGLKPVATSEVDWSPLNEVYNQLSASYNGEISINDVIEGAKKGLTESLGDTYTVYMDEEETADF